MDTNDVTAKLKKLQEQQRDLAAKRDQLQRQAGADERRLQEAVERLQALGIEGAANMSADELRQKADALAGELQAKVAEAEALVAKGESILARYASHQ